MKTITTEIEIAATAEKVWDKIMDFDHYSDWNPFIRKISGSTAIGENLTISIQLKDKKPMTFKPVVLVKETNKELRWKGKLVVKGIFDGEHYFKLTEQENGSVRFEHGEIFSGILITLMPAILKDTKSGFEEMNEALKKVCEAI